MRFLVFLTEAAALEAVSQIDTNGRDLFSMAGYKTDADGSIIGKRFSDRVDQPYAAATVTWDIPRQRLDGKWVISHPENQPAAAKYAEQIMAGVTFDSIETYSADWFPVRHRP